MTLHLSVINRVYALQVSDRLLTISPGTVFDPDANKNLILFARNGVVTMGYSGVAYVGDVPTDQWLVGRLTGLDLHEEKPWDFQGFPGERIRDIGAVLESLRLALEDIPNVTRRSWVNQWISSRFAVSAFGFQWKRNGRHRPMGARLLKPTGETRFRSFYLPRHWAVKPRSEGTRYKVHAEGQGSLSLMDRITGELGDKDVEGTEKSLRDEIRREARSVSTIGSDCISIFVGCPGFPLVVVRYLPDSRSTVPFRTSQGNERMEVGYRPWIVTPGTLYAPAIMRGKWGIPVGHYTVGIDAPNSGSGIISASISQKRKRPRP